MQNSTVSEGITTRPQQVEDPQTTPTEGGEISIKDLSLNQVCQVAADTAKEVITGTDTTLHVKIGPPTNMGDPLLRTRRRVNFTVYLHHIGASEVELMRGAAAIAALCRLPLHQVAYVQSRHNKEAHGTILPVPIQITNQLAANPPQVVTGEYIVSGIPNWAMLIQLHAYQYCTTWIQWHAVVTAVERLTKLKMQLERLGAVSQAEESCRVDYRAIESQRRGMLYTEIPRRNATFQDDPTHDPRMVGWNPIVGLAWHTERRRSESHTMPVLFQN